MTHRREQLSRRGGNGPDEGSRPVHNPTEGDRYEQYGSARQVRVASADEVTLTKRYHKPADPLWDDDFSREEFDRLVESGELVYLPPCDYCGLPMDPTDPEERPPLHYGCWYENASVAERCEAEHNRAGGYPMAGEALRTDEAPEAYLLGVIGDPGRSPFDREEAHLLLSGAVDVHTIIEAEAQCPNCLEAESWPMDPETGEVRCYCGTLMKEGDA